MKVFESAFVSPPFVSFPEEAKNPIFCKCITIKPTASLVAARRENLHSVVCSLDCGLAAYWSSDPLDCEVISSIETPPGGPICNFSFPRLMILILASPQSKPGFTCFLG